MQVVHSTAPQYCGVHSTPDYTVHQYSQYSEVVKYTVLRILSTPESSKFLLK